MKNKTLSFVFVIYLLNNLNNSPIHKTNEEEPIMIAQYFTDKGMKLNI